MYEILILGEARSTQYYIWKFSTVTWIAMNVTVLYYVLGVVSLVSRRVFGYLYLIALSSNALVAFGYWVLLLTEPRMVGRLMNAADWQVFAITIFLCGGNFLLVLVDRSSAKGLLTFSVRELAVYEGLCVSMYMCLGAACRYITGMNVYGFMDDLGSEYIVGYYI